MDNTNSRTSSVAKCFNTGFFFFLYTGTPLYGHLLNTHTHFLWTILFVPTKLSSYVFSYVSPLNADTD